MVTPFRCSFSRSSFDWRCIPRSTSFLREELVGGFDTEYESRRWKEWYVLFDFFSFFSVNSVRGVYSFKDGSEILVGWILIRNFSSFLLIPTSFVTHFSVFIAWIIMEYIRLQTIYIIYCSIDNMN